VPLLEDKIVLVNGGTQGVGAGIVRAALREGAHVTFTGRRRDVGEALAAELAGTAFVQADLTDPAQARGSVEQVVAAHGRIDCLVNCGRASPPAARCWTPHRSCSTSTSPSTCGAVLPDAGRVKDMVARKAPGTIVNIITIVGARRSAVPGAVRRRQGRPGRAHPQRRARPPLGPDPDQRPEHRLDRDRGRGRHPAPFHGAGDDWLEKAAKNCRWASSGRSTRSPTSSSSCSRSAAGWSPAPSSTGTRTSSAPLD
jgi:hypothetical protein